MRRQRHRSLGHLDWSRCAYCSIAQASSREPEPANVRPTSHAILWLTVSCSLPDESFAVSAQHAAFFQQELGARLWWFLCSYDWDVSFRTRNMSVLRSQDCRELFCARPRLNNSSSFPATSLNSSPAQPDRRGPRVWANRRQTADSSYRFDVRDYLLGPRLHVSAVESAAEDDLWEELCQQGATASGDQ